MPESSHDAISPPQAHEYESTHFNPIHKVVSFSGSLSSESNMQSSDFSAKKSAPQLFSSSEQQQHHQQQQQQQTPLNDLDIIKEEDEAIEMKIKSNNEENTVVCIDHVEIDHKV